MDSVAQLTLEEKRQLLAKKLRKKAQSIPLSFAQQRLWFLDQLEPGKAVYNVPVVLHLDGPLDREALADSVNEIVRRHDVLRTIFRTLNEQPVQVVVPALEIPLITVNLTWLPLEERAERARQLATQEIRRPFNLEQGPLVRASLVQIAEDTHIFILVMHHIVSDGWSVDVLLREFAVLYPAFAQGQPSPLPALPIQYADFSVWQRQWMQGEVLEKQLTYWREQLADLATLQLATDYPRLAIQSFRGATREITFSQTQTEALKKLCQQEGVTLFMALLASFSALLARYTGQSDIAIGTAIANRNRSEIEQLIGFFVNTLVFRTDLRGNPGFRELLKRVQQVALDAYAHQDIPFEKLVDELQPERDLSSQPLFQVIFNFYNTAIAVQKIGDLSLSALQLDSGTAKFDLSITVIDTPEGLRGWIEYSTDLFKATTIARLALHWQTLLAGCLSDPDAPLATLPLLSDDEREQMLITWNATKLSYPSENVLQRLFEDQVAEIPERIALICGEEQLSYGELQVRANQLAHYLRTSGVGPEVLVGVCMERSSEMIVGLLAILKAGGAYVPLDPAYPKERLAFMLADAQVPVLLTQPHLLAELPVYSGVCLTLEPQWSAFADYPVDNLSSVDTSAYLAYMIYTSGSTGQPKGVQISHVNLLNLVFWHQQRYDITPADRATHLAGVAFDASVWEIWPYLTAGASLSIPSEETRLSPECLRDWLIEQEITISFLPTPLAERLLALPWPEVVSLRALLTGGDQLHALTVEKLPFTLLNHYGPTEFTVVTSAGEVTPRSERVPAIGRAIANTQIYVLDQQLQPVPIGVPGELYVGGASLARGYLHQPALTAERFIANPFSSEAGARLYRTGDLVRYLEDGTLDFLGRIDTQVKIQGYRIELGEIESLLRQHHAIQECAVIVDETGGGKRLVAFMVPATTQMVEPEALRRYLQERLPDYMVPTLLIPLAELPLSANGKVDRKALPALDLLQRSLSQSPVGPRSVLEQTLVGLWQQVLGLAQVGISENFFALGGDSIVSIQLVSRAKQHGLRLTPKMLFQYPTIAELARVVGEDIGEPLIQAEQEPVSGEVPLTPIQHWFFEQNVPQPQHWNQSLLLECQPGNTRVVFLEQIVAAWLKQHDALWLRFRQQGANWQQIMTAISDLEPSPVTHIDMTAITSAQQKDLLPHLYDEIQASLDLNTGPILRAVSFVGEQEGPMRVLLVAHHLVVDAVSWRILLEDFQLAWSQLANGQAIQFPAKTTSFQQWSRQLHAYAQTEAVRQDLEYWMQLEGQEFIPLPLEKEGGVNTIASARSVTVQLSAEETRALLQDVPAAYHTQINDVLLTALGCALSEWIAPQAENVSLLLNLEGHGREEIGGALDVSRTVGWFTTMYPVLLRLSSHYGPGQALKAIKEQVRAIPLHGLSYGLLRYLHEDRRVSERIRAFPQAGISFNYLGQFDQSLPHDAPFVVLTEPSGQPISKEAKRYHLLDIVGYVNNGQLFLDWTYSAHQHHEETITALAHDMLEALCELIAHCQTDEAGGYTPSDFPLANLTQEQIDTVLGAQRQIEAVYPLSPLQSGLLFHTLYAPDAGDYIIQVCYTFKGQFQPEYFARAWEVTMENHPVLRTAFKGWDDFNQPLQIVHQRVQLPFIQHDWRGLSAAEQAERFAEYRKQDRAQGFDVTQTPLMRVTLVRTEDERYECTWTYHHLLLDGWSLPLVLQDVFESYEALCHGQSVQSPARLIAGTPGAPVYTLRQRRAYQDYIAWLAHQQLAEAEAFWRQQLEGFTEPGLLPTRRSSASTQKTEARSYDELTLELSPALTQQLHTLARQHQLTLSTLFQGAWTLLLSHYSQRDDIIFGSVVSGRSAELADIEAMVGLFINTLPVRAKVAPDVTLLSWLQALQDHLVEMRNYEYVPLVQIQAWSELPHGAMLFESLLIFENYPLSASATKHDASLEILAVQAREQTHYPLTIFIMPGEQFHVKMVFDQYQFEMEEVGRLLTHLHSLLKGFTSHLALPLATLSPLTQAERNLLLHGWNATQLELSEHGLLARLFEAQTAKTPDAVALVHGQQHLTYGELDQGANQLAHYLRELGVGPEVLVGICVERSVEMVVGLLGIVKAGGAYIPLDPLYPQERLLFMVADSGLSVLLTQHHLLARLPEHQARVVCLDADYERIASQPRGTPDVVVQAEHPLYVIYTSGSTGRPKGVQVVQGALKNLLLTMREQPGIQASDRLLAVTTLSFDIAGLEIYLPLTVGAQTILIDAEVAADGERLAEQMRLMGATIMQATPATWRLLRDVGLVPDPDLTILCGGEAFPPELTHYLVRSAAAVWNVYGPTETTVWSARYRVDAHDEQVPIGYPVANTQAYVLDRALQPVIPGVIGELYLGGAGLARGYLKRPDSTAERFIPDPFSSQPGSRLYRTGDLARYLPDGRLECLGRVDSQVKLRGYRIELGEIENVLSQHPALRAAAVLAREDTPGQQRLVAYLVARESVPPADELRTYLRQYLPDYMLPALFIALPTMPLTPSGKIDRRALPAPEVGRPELGQDFVAARNDIEKVLVGLWSEVLGIERIGVHDSFFLLGGHSLLVAQLVARIGKTFQIKLPLRSVFDAQTVAEMAQALVRYEPRAGQSARIAALRIKIAAMSPDDVQMMLRKQKERDQ